MSLGCIYVQYMCLTYEHTYSHVAKSHQYIWMLVLPL